MEIVKKVKDCTEISKRLREKGLTIGFVPTMGFLHEGHLSLIRAAGKQCDRVILSIFVNPTQFGPGEDFKKYPRDIKRDRQLAESEGVNYIFYPTVSEMYKSDHRTFVDVRELGEIMCGKYRPGHFTGVSTVVLKLLNITKANRVYFGKKDYQQMVIVKKMAEDLSVDVDIIGIPTVREKDGLAMSSRNSYLDKSERENAVILYKCLNHAKVMIKGGERDLKVVHKKIMGELEGNSFVRKVDYVDFRDPFNLKEISILGDFDKRVLVAIAAWIGNTRLIDNIVIKI
jgi:pantoate--beta-alanine ligase